MLRKLIGYDNRIQSKFFGGVYAVMGVLAGIAAVLKALNEHFNHVIVLQYAYQIAWVICRAAAIAVIVGSIIYVIALFRNNLLKDEGYFMHTLPVPAWQLYVSKLVTGTVWIVVSIVVVILAYMLGSLDFHLPILEILRDSGVEELKIVWLAGIAIFLSIPAALSQFYASFSIGYTWEGKGNSRDRDIISVVALIFVYMAQQIVGMITLALFITFQCGSIFKPHLLERVTTVLNTMDHVGEGTKFNEYLCHLMGTVSAETFLLCVAFGVVAVWRMSRHLNME